MIYTNNFKQLASKNLKIEKVSDKYFAWYTPTIWFRKFKSLGSPSEVMETYYDKGSKSFLEKAHTLSWEEIEQEKADWAKFTWKTYVIEINWVKYPFYKTFKKVYDVTIKLEEDTNINRYKDVYWIDNEVIIQWISASKLWAILENVLEVEVPLGDNWFPLRDWEEGFIDKLAETTFKFTVRWEGLATKYTWKEAKFTPKASWIEPMKWDINIDDLPFN